MGDFKDYLMNESRVVLGQRIGDIANAAAHLGEEAPNMGKRQIIKHVERLAAMIRRILHGSWHKRETNNLKKLQKVGVGLLKAIDEKGELEPVIQSGANELQTVLQNLQTPIHQAGTPEGQHSSEKGAKEQAVDKPHHKSQEKEEKEPQGPVQQPPPEGTIPPGVPGQMPPGPTPPIPGGPAPPMPGQPAPRMPM